MKHRHCIEGGSKRYCVGLFPFLLFPLRFAIWGSWAAYFFSDTSACAWIFASGVIDHIYMLRPC